MTTTSVLGEKRQLPAAEPIAEASSSKRPKLEEPSIVVLDDDDTILLD